MKKSRESFNGMRIPFKKAYEKGNLHGQPALQSKDTKKFPYGQIPFAFVYISPFCRFSVFSSGLRAARLRVVGPCCGVGAAKSALLGARRGDCGTFFRGKGARDRAEGAQGRDSRSEPFEKLRKEGTLTALPFVECVKLCHLRRIG